MKLVDQLTRFVEPLKRKLTSMICCALINAVKDDKDIQLVTLNIQEGEEHKNLERIQEYGFTSNPPPNSEAVVLFVGGNRSHGLVIATETSRYRLKNLPSGAVALYNMKGDYVKLTDNKIEVNANEVILADGSKRLLTEEIFTALNAHVHVCASSGSPSGPAQYPAGVSNPFTVNSHATSKTKAD